MRRPAAEVVLGTGLQIRYTREEYTVRFCQVAAMIFNLLLPDAKFFVLI